jgi:rubrerythrin
MFEYHAPNKCPSCDSKFCNYVQIPSLPLKGPKTFEQILCYIHKAIVDEATAADFYCRLLKEAPNKLHREFIEHAYRDELEHLQIFSKLYCYYTDHEPEYRIEPIHCPCYKDGLLIALEGELEAVEFYRNVQLYTMDQVIIDTFFLAMVDEQTHATMFSTLYSTCK